MGHRDKGKSENKKQAYLRAMEENRNTLKEDSFSSELYGCYAVRVVRNECYSSGVHQNPESSHCCACGPPCANNVRCGNLPNEEPVTTWTFPLEATLVILCNEAAAVSPPWTADQIWPEPFYTIDWPFMRGLHNLCGKWNGNIILVLKIKLKSCILITVFCEHFKDPSYTYHFVLPET